MFADENNSNIKLMPNTLINTPRSKPKMPQTWEKLNVVSHVYGDHKKCVDQYCLKHG